MKTISKSAFLSLMAAPFLLSACGEGYELVPTQNMFPYGNERTAGTGYAYVLAKMLPKKEMKVEAVHREMKPEPVKAEPQDDILTLEEDPVVEAPKEEAVVEPPPAEPPAKDADELFLENGKK